MCRAAVQYISIVGFRSLLKQTVKQTVKQTSRIPYTALMRRVLCAGLLQDILLEQPSKLEASRPFLSLSLSLSRSCAHAIAKEVAVADVLFLRNMEALQGIHPELCSLTDAQSHILIHILSCLWIAAPAGLSRAGLSHVGLSFDVYCCDSHIA